MALDLNTAQQRYFIHMTEAGKLEARKSSGINIRIYDIDDEINGIKNHYVIGLKDSPSLNIEEEQTLKLLLEGKTEPVVNDGYNSMIKLDSGELVIFRDTPSDIVRKVLNDTTEYPYLMSFRIVKMHHYISIQEKETGVSYEFGVAPKTYNSIFSTPYIRNDTIYNLRHFKEKKYPSNISQEHGKIFDTVYSKNIPDSALISINFDLTAKQAQDLEIYLRQENSKFSQEWYMYFNFYILFSNNCADFAGKIYKKLFGNGHFGEYIISENLDFNDKGVLYTFISSRPNKFFQFLSKIVDGLSDTAFDKSYSEILNDIMLSWRGTSLSKILENASNSLYSNYYIENISEFLSNTFLEVSSYLGNKDIQYFLYSRTGENKYAYDESFYGNTKLHVAAYNNDLYYLKQLSEKERFIIDVTNQFGDSPLHIAVKKSYEFAIKLLEKGANPNILNNKGYTPLQYVISSNWDEEKKLNLLELLLEKDANPNLVDDTGDSNALVEAVKAGCSVKLFKLILSYCNKPINILGKTSNIGINFTDTQGKNLARIAVEKKNEQVKAFLKENYYYLFRGQTVDGQTVEEYEVRMENWDMGELKYPYERIISPFKYNQKTYDVCKKKTAKQQNSKYESVFSYSEEENYCIKENIYENYEHIWA
ncbi:ankyrin repeat domain-containing protein [Holosporaceae bacterium 'Namur']|nr:ankyrin repeat domain-containing protein [Holosporaceae bacterium 'Namur']